MRLPIQVVIYVARKNGNTFEYLVLHRLPGKQEFWQGVSGGVEQGETIEEAARRELLEEIGLSSELHNIGYSYSFPVAEMWKSLYEWFTAHPEDPTIVVHNFVTVVGAQFVPKLDGQEHDTFKWCSFDEAIALLFWEGDKKALGFVQAWLAMLGT
jgi:8-oxo-dGTP pyrophosphatase MutT (NUDIX family)